MESSNPFKTLEQHLSRIETLVLDIKKAQEDQKLNIKNDSSNDIIDVNAAAAFLGKAIQTIYGLCHRKEIPVMRRGHKLYFSKRQLLNWLKDSERKTVEQLKIEADDGINK